MPKMTSLLRSDMLSIHFAWLCHDRIRGDQGFKRPRLSFTGNQKKPRLKTVQPALIRSQGFDIEA